jgi:hypothetical protein
MNTRLPSKSEFNFLEKIRPYQEDSFYASLNLVWNTTDTEVENYIYTIIPDRFKPLVTKVNWVQVVGDPVNLTYNSQDYSIYFTNDDTAQLKVFKAIFNLKSGLPYIIYIDVLDLTISQGIGWQFDDQSFLLWDDNSYMPLESN